MQENVMGKAALISVLGAICGPAGTKHTTDMYGNEQHWFELPSPSLIVRAAQALSEAGARLSLISGFARKEGENVVGLSACYTFVIGGMVVCVTANMTDAEPQVPTITPWFANADWHEREMREIVGVPVADQPNPDRLFLDVRLDAGVIGGMVPLSVMMNAASSKNLWEHILSTKNGPAAGRH